MRDETFCIQVELDLRIGVILIHLILVLLLLLLLNSKSMDHVLQTLYNLDLILVKSSFLILTLFVCLTDKSLHHAVKWLVEETILVFCVFWECLWENYVLISLVVVID